MREVRLTGISSLHPKAAVLVLPDTSHLVVKRTEAEAGMESQHLIGILSKKKPLEVFERSWKGQEQSGRHQKVDMRLWWFG